VVFGSANTLENGRISQAANSRGSVPARYSAPSRIAAGPVPCVMAYLYLVLAVGFEVIGTAALQASEQFTRPKPLVLTAIGYAAAFYFLSLVLRTMPVGIAYAIWSGFGVILITLVGLVWFGQRLDLPAVIGLGLIVAGVAVINLFSKAAVH
jgi:small multidrug resistance pump